MIIGLLKGLEAHVAKASDVLSGGDRLVATLREEACVPLNDLLNNK